MMHSGAVLSMGRLLGYGVALAMIALSSAPCLAAAAKKSQPALADLAIQAQKHGIDCPLPRSGACVVKKPVGPRYRVLTPGANLEDMGDYWLADFAKTKDPKSNRLVLRVLGENGDLHEIEVRFPPDPAAREKPAAATPEKPKEKPKEEVKEGEAN